MADEVDAILRQDGVVRERASPGSDAPQGTGPTPLISAPVKTATTPGCLRAGLMLMPRIRAAAWGLRTMQAWCMPGIWISST